MPGELKCPVCGRIFQPEKRNQKYCCRQCKRRAEYQRFREHGNLVFKPRICEVCGKEFTPKTPIQKTCGGNCTAIYMLRHYGKTTPQERERRRQERKSRYPHFIQQSLIEVGKGYEMAQKYRKMEYVETSKAFLDCLQPNAGSQDSRIDLANKAIEAARQIDGIIPEWRKWELPRQAALLNIAVGFGALRLSGRRDIYNALHNGKWDEFKSLVLQSAWAAANGKRAVRMCRQVVCGWWL